MCGCAYAWREELMEQKWNDAGCTRRLCVCIMCGCGRVRGAWVWVRINGAEYGMLLDITAPSLTKGKSIASQCWTGVEGRPRGGVSRTYTRDAFVHQGGARGLQNAMTSSEERTSAESRGLPHREVTDGLRRPRLLRGPTQSISVLEQILGC